MKIVQLNAVCGVGSTGGITMEISKMLTSHNIENYILYTSGNYDYDLGIKYSNPFLVKVNALLAKVLGNYGFNSLISTYRLIRILNKITPDIVHLHNIHGHDLNLSIFFRYLKKTRAKVVWTFHDCWAFTGYCMHFDRLECDKWKTSCQNCIQAKKYSWFFDNSNRLYNNKKQLFTSLDNLTIVTPSQWLANLTKESYLSKFPVEVIYNGIDLDVFIPRTSDFRKRYNLENKTVILGVPKGKLQYFMELSKIIDNNCSIVLVGLTEKEMQNLPKNIIGLPRTKDRFEMAELFTMADVYVNTTLEDTFPTVNLESLACGTPIITFNTGGSPEALDEETGMVVEKRNMHAVYEAIKALKNGNDKSDACIRRAHRLYDAKKRFNDYYELYIKIMEE